MTFIFHRQVTIPGPVSCLLPIATAAMGRSEVLRSWGRDEHSIWADPLFIDWKNEDFHVKPSSPALVLGIEPIDVTPIGLREDFPPRLRIDKALAKRVSP